MKVSAVIVTRGNVDLRPVLDSLPPEWEQVVWNNAGQEIGSTVSVQRPGPATRESRSVSSTGVGDLAVYGRYAAIEYASGDLIYVQDDDCVVSDPRAIANTWEFTTRHSFGDTNHVVANMPQAFRHAFYDDNYLVGFGAAFHRDAPERAFTQFKEARIRAMGGVCRDLDQEYRDDQQFQRTCDIVFTGLTHGVLVDVPYEDREFASDPDRMWRQPTHVAERQKMRDMVRAVAAA